MKLKVMLLLLGVLLMPASLVRAQKKPEKPKIHADFYFGSYPSSRDAAEQVANDKARMVLVGLHQGWDVEKIAKEIKSPVDEIQKIYDNLEDQKLAGDEVERLAGGAGTGEEPRPFMVVLRERDTDRVKDSLDRHAQDFAKLLLANWKDIEVMAGSLAGANGVPKGQLMYEIVVSGILLSGMEDAFREDKTLMPSAPRRAGGQRFYAWLVESDARFAGNLKREVRQSDGFDIVSIGSEFARERAGINEIRSAHSMLLEDPAEARRFRSFLATFSRDHLLPFFKKNRQDFLKLGEQIEAGKYIAFSEFFAWYYNQIVNAAVRQLAATNQIQLPAGQYTYAVRSAQP